MLNTNVAICIIAVIIVIYVFILIVIRQCESSLLAGAWNGSVEFCKEASLSKLFVYMFANDSYIGHSREAYIIMESDNGVLLDQLVRIDFSYAASIVPTIETERKYDIYIDFLDKDEPEFLPSNLCMYYYPLVGKLIFASDETAYMTLYKDCASNDL